MAKPTGIFLAATLWGYLLLKRAPALPALIPALGDGLGLLLHFVYNFFRFANPLTFGQPWIFSFSALPAGFAGLLLSPGRGIIWYSPAVLSAIPAIRKAWRTKPTEVLLIAGLFLSFQGLHSLYENWHGGWSWGPRYLLPTLRA